VYVLEVCRSRSLGMLVISHQSALLDQVCTRHLQVE
ncbi:peptide ABC transporter ATP-binding protein, partial [Salmonella enterica subsp. enterica serovar Infantis]|nr:peptide ABC transporter ATP-binding protein [Salmonella enterica subsp. enterica serovar Infantis]